MKIARVFPSKTNFTPDDEACFFGPPPDPRLVNVNMDFDEIHISTIFTWDIEKAKRLGRQWERFGKIILGGPAFGDPGGEFTPGKFLKPGYVITSRGCPNKCWYCFVPKREGSIRELKIHDGNNLIDNNLLACGEKHIADVFKMLSDKRRIIFEGFYADLVSDEIAFEIRKLKVREIWMAYDRPGDLEKVALAMKRLGVVPNRRIYIYVLAGFENDSLEKAEARCLEIAKLGGYPFMMLYQPEKEMKYSKEWRRLQRLWARPALWKTYMKGKI